MHLLEEKNTCLLERFKAFLNGQRDPDKEREKLVESKGFHKAMKTPNMGII